MDCEFLQRWPTLQALRKARPATLEAFWKTHGSRSEKRLHERLDVLAGARALTEDIDTIAPLVLRVESLVRQLQVLAQSLDVVESRIQELAATFEDYLPPTERIAPAGHRPPPCNVTAASRLSPAKVATPALSCAVCTAQTSCGKASMSGPPKAGNIRDALARLCVTISPEKNPSIPSSASSPTNGSRSSHAPGTTANPTTKSATSNASSNAAVQSANSR